MILSKTIPFPFPFGPESVGLLPSPRAPPSFRSDPLRCVTRVCLSFLEISGKSPKLVYWSLIGVVPPFSHSLLLFVFFSLCAFGLMKPFFFAKSHLLTTPLIPWQCFSPIEKGKNFMCPSLFTFSLSPLPRRPSFPVISRTSLSADSCRIPLELPQISPPHPFSNFYCPVSSTKPALTTFPVKVSYPHPRGSKDLLPLPQPFRASLSSVR